MNTSESKQLAFTEVIVDKIMDELIRKGLTQKDLAKIMNKSEAEVSRWLSGKSNLTLATLAKISVALSVDLLPVKMKNKPYRIPEPELLMVADSGANFGLDINAMKLEIMGAIMSINDIHQMKKVSSALSSVINSSIAGGYSQAWENYELSPEIQALSADRKVDAVDYKIILEKEIKEKNQ